MDAQKSGRRIKSFKDFRPFPLLWSGHAQTIAGAYWPSKPDRFLCRSHEVPLSDSTKLILREDLSSPQRTRSILLVHGLAGSDESRHILRLSRLFQTAGYRVFRINLRGAGASMKYSAKHGHAGRSEDLYDVIQFIANLYPLENLSAVTVSLSANLALKLLGERAEPKIFTLDSLVAVCPPVSLRSSCLRLGRGLNRIFERHFISELVRAQKKRIQLFPQYSYPKIAKNFKSIVEYDDLLTAPMWGFKNADDYYSQSSCRNLLKDVQLKSLILASKDDPIVSTQELLETEVSSAIELHITHRGGHLGYLAWPSPFRWMDRFIFDWIQSLDARG